MMRTLILTGLALLMVILPPRLTQAQSPSRANCRQQIIDEMAREQRIFRSVILGQSAPEQAQVGEVRYDTAGNAWYKKADLQWHSVAARQTDPLSNQDLSSRLQVEPRRGFLETRGVSTSELIPYLGESLRAFQCRLELVCNAARQSQPSTEGSPINITATALGCIEVERQTMAACHLAEATPDDQARLDVYCERALGSAFRHEVDTLKLLIENDAAYRTGLQMAGVLNLFLQEFNAPLLNSLRQTINLMGALNRIPCFLSSCDASPPATP